MACSPAAGWWSITLTACSAGAAIGIGLQTIPVDLSDNAPST